MKERTGMNASRRRMVCKQLKNDWMLYALLLPVLLWYIIFCYLPMGGITLAFRNYRYDMGLWHSPWVGLLHFKTMFQDAEFWRAFSNTLIFSFGKLLFHFPIPIIVAILLNEIRHPRVKKFFQTVFTFPHFISWVVLSGILINMFASNGIINQLLGQMGFEQIAPLMSLSAFRPFIWISNIWKEFGSEEDAEAVTAFIGREIQVLLRSTPSCMRRPASMARTGCKKCCTSHGPAFEAQFVSC